MTWHLLAANSKSVENFEPRSKYSFVVVITKKNCIRMFAAGMRVISAMTGNSPLFFDLVCYCDLDVEVPSNFSVISLSVSSAMDFGMSLDAWGITGVAGTDTVDDFFLLSSGAGLVRAVLVRSDSKELNKRLASAV